MDIIGAIFLYIIIMRGSLHIDRIPMSDVVACYEAIENSTYHGPEVSDENEQVIVLFCAGEDLQEGWLQEWKSFKKED